MISASFFNLKKKMDINSLRSNDVIMSYDDIDMWYSPEGYFTGEAQDN